LKKRNGEMMMRRDGRSPDSLRPVTIRRRFTATPAGSVLWTQGQTIILATASVTPQVPEWFRPDRPGGWLTAEYVMLPASTPQRKPWPDVGHTDSRGTEIQRLIGRALRAVVDLSKLGKNTIAIDCQVLQADGGTRTASICAAYLALADAVATVDAQAALTDQIAAVSVGLVKDQILLDLDYSEDSKAEVDLNVACAAGGQFVEVQGSAEGGGGLDRARFNAMLDLAVVGCKRLLDLQSQARDGIMQGS
jgi:ribonuclease PH